jgi:hypothetical protein
MNLDWLYIVLLLIGIEIGHRKGLIFSAGILLLLFPIRMLSYRLAFLISDLFLNGFKGILDFKLQWTESVIRTVEAGDLAHFSEGSRLLLQHPMMQNDRVSSWISEMTPEMIYTPGGIDRLSDLNLIQGTAFASLLVLLAIAMILVGRITRKLEVGKHDRIGGAVVFSIVGLFLVYQALLMVAPSVWLVPASPIAQWVADSWLIKEFFAHNPLMYM